MNEWRVLERRPLGHPRWPSLVWYRAAQPKAFRLNWNRYPGSIIGAAMQIRGRVLSFVWGRPARYESIR